LNEARVQSDYERKVASVRALLGDDAFGAGWDAGSAMTLEQALAFALARDA